MRWGDPQRRSWERSPAAWSPCHSQNKPERYSEGKRVNLMTAAIFKLQKSAPFTLREKLHSTKIRPLA